MSALVQGLAPLEALRSVRGGRWESFCRDAYWSWCWNVAASFRLRVYGSRTMPGDVVWADGTLRTVEEGEESRFRLDQVLLPRWHEGSGAQDTQTKTPGVDELSRASVLPGLPGLARLMLRLLRGRDSGPSGGHWVYRPLLVRPLFLRCKVLPASRRHRNIDFESPSGILSQMLPLECVLDDGPRVSIQDLRSADAKVSLVDVELEFALPRGCFATSLLRDLRGVDMSSAFRSPRALRLQRGNPK
ncbi:unnamed protein product [Polarella glacialis]|uniref:tRNA pseudouridine synthase D n=1 Tax=Polarella glacialis TaxID=89957 RepID=A0A813L5H5_POLGL|nr:unnamed protein product [Polarella glacialis]